jgi:hypothetical protein
MSDGAGDGVSSSTPWECCIGNSTHGGRSVSDGAEEAAT